MDGVQHRPALSCNPMCGFNAIVWKTHFILLVIIWSSGKCLSHPPSYCAFKTVTDSFKWCLQIPWGLVTRKFWGWCSASFLSRPLRLLEVNAFLIEGLLLPISFKWQIRGPAQSPLPCCGQVQEIGKALLSSGLRFAPLEQVKEACSTQARPDPCGVVELQASCWRGSSLYHAVNLRSFLRSYVRIYQRSFWLTKQC